MTGGEGRDLSLLWWRRASCEGVELGDGQLDWSSDEDHAVTRTTIDGVERDVVLTVVDRVVFGFRLSVAVAIYDAQSGELVDCHELPRPVEETGTILAVGEKGNYYLAYSTPNMDMDGYNSGFYVGDFNTGAATETPIVRAGARGFDNIALTRDGVLAAAMANDVYAVHASEMTCSMRRTVAELGGAASGDISPSVTGLYAETPGALLVSLIQPDAVARGDEWVMRVGADGATDGPVYSDRELYGPPMDLGGYRVAMRRVSARRSEDGVSVHRAGAKEYLEKACTRPVLLDEDTIACTLRWPADLLTRRTIAVFSPDGATRKLIRLPPPAKDEDLGDRAWLLAAAGRNLVATSALQLAIGHWTLRVHVINVDSGDIRSIDLPNPDAIEVRPARAVYLLPDGTIIVVAMGGVYAIRTDLPGLAPTSYPRGAQHGGNENRGPVALPAVDDAGLP